MTPFWSDWQPLAVTPTPNADTLAEILDGGQAFRWFRSPEPSALRSSGSEGGSADTHVQIWHGTWAGCVAELRLADDRLTWRAPRAIAAHTGPALHEYFAADRDWAALADALPWRSDAHLAHCLAAFPGLRILRQPLGETLLHFLCSATKQIVQIKQMSALLAEHHGAPLLPLSALNPLSAVARSISSGPRACRGASAKADRLSTQPHRLPTWAELAEIPEVELRRCLLGFRARYIHQTARFLAAHPGWLEATAARPYAEAKAGLCELPGVGEKIADCVLLFGAGRLEAFPVDVWILKTLAGRYGLDNWKPAQVAHFGRTHFGPLAGLAQQYLFACERRAAGR
ncbi:MAG TPA: DNA glycosylase [Opitutaceae bacterium]|jgi:N-glycosylase/DNA lyase|nr:DNA glycosylase [Opitutaceae bacterium]